MLVRQLEEELRIRSMQNPSLEMRQQVEAIYAENEHLTREVAILRETVKVNFLIFFWQFDVGHPKMKMFDTGTGAEDRDAEADAAVAGREHQETPWNAAK